MVNYLTLDILIYLHMIMKYILKKTKIKQLREVRNENLAFMVEKRKCTEENRFKEPWTL